MGLEPAVLGRDRERPGEPGVDEQELACRGLAVQLDELAMDHAQARVAQAEEVDLARREDERPHHRGVALVESLELEARPAELGPQVGALAVPYARRGDA